MSQTAVAEPLLLPASFAQQRLWFLDRLEPGTAVYNLTRIVEVAGPLDAAALRRSLDALVERHETLRTTLAVFAATDGAPVQVVAAPGPVDLPFFDLADLPDGDDAASRLAREEVRRPFDLERGPLFRALLLRVAPDRHVLTLAFHHVITDGWSMDVFLRELAALYAGFTAGRPACLPELPIQYGDYAHWQRGELSGETLERELGWWRDRLTGVPVLELPADRPRTALASPPAGHAALLLPPALRRGLDELARGERATLFMTLLAAFQALLARYSGQRDIAVGAPIANRGQAEIEGLIGFFVNTLVLRTDLSGDPGFRALLRRVREATLGAYAHQEMPFEKLVEELKPERRPGTNPLFQVFFTVQEPGAAELRAGLVTLRPTSTTNGVAKFDLLLAAEPSAAGLKLEAEYRADLFAPETIERMLAHLGTLLASAVAAPDTRLSDLELMTAPERDQLAVWTTAHPVAIEPAENLCLHELFAAQAARTPEAIAVCYENETLTYRELDARANQLAHYLRSLGIGPGALVAVALERSLSLPTALLGVLKAGAAYLPVDPGYPAERQAVLLEDSQAAVLVSEERLAQALSPTSPFPPEHTVLLDRDAAAIGMHPATAPRTGAGPDDLAYVIYTSGSTGRPKGVPVPHANVVRLFRATESWFGFGEQDVWTLFHSYAFDFSVWELWGALLYGGRLVMVPYWVSRSPAAFLDLLRAERVTVLNQTPSAFRQLSWAAPLPDLQWVIFGGEALEVGGLAEWFDRQGDEQPHLVNMYGITETTVHVTFRPLSKADLEAAHRSFIGVPIPDLSVHLLDAALRPVPVGVPGEIHVGGAGLARGYLGRPALTAERFVPDPFSGVPGARLYRSGDLARRLENGAFEYLGRIDQQVKIRGFRIELGEIETALAALSGVRAAVVLAREDARGGKALIAYVVPEPGAALPAERLRALLRDRLPDYMIPSAFVELAALPLNANGKVDKAALPAPAAAGSQAGLTESNAAPHTPFEELVAQVYADVLGAAQVGVRDDFFALGGHSLLATQVVSRLQAVLGVEVPLRLLFEEPAVAGLAARIASLGAGGRPVAPPVERAPRSGALPLSFAQQRLWFLHQMDPASPAYDISRVFALPAPVDRKALAAALAELVRRHEVLRTVYVRTAGGDPVQVVLPPMPVELPDDDGERAPFDLAAGPVLRASLVRRDEGDPLLRLDLHHIAADGWSLQILVRELSALYAAFAAGLPSPLPEPALQYADFAVWQRGWLAGETLAAEVGFWRERLAGAPTLLELPSDRPRPAVQSFRGGQVAAALPADLAAGLRDLARREGATLFMTLLAGFAALVSRLTDREDFLLGTAVANRNRVETEEMIGLFVNTLVLRADLSGTPGPMNVRDLLRRLRGMALDAYAHQDLPFEKLVEELAPERDLSHAPLVQVAFSLQDMPQQPPAAGLLRTVPAESHGTTAKLDLGLHAAASGPEIELAAEYAADLFDGATIERLLGSLRTVLTAMVESPGARLADLPLLTAEERWQILRAGVRAPEATTFPTFFQIFEAQCDRTPDAPALVFGDDVVTYRELDARANRLAWFLRRRGVGPEVVVAVLLERSIELVVSFLAILKAGGVYLPLDPIHPPERLAQTLRDARPLLVLTAEAEAGRLAAEERPRAVLLRTAGADIDRESAVRPPSDVVPENLAYIIYTSGSTGRPKGAQLTHGGLGNMAEAQRVLGVGAGERVLLFGSPSFDASISEITLALRAGATLCLGSRDDLQPGRALADLVRRHAVSAVILPPSIVDTLGAPQEFPGLRMILAVGEACPPELMARWAPGRRFLNGYGPTEITIWATWADLSSDAGLLVSPLPGTGRGELGEGPGVRASAPAIPVPVIGRPIDNLRTSVLDRGLHLLPAGVPGQLHIGGVGLSRGYLGRPELTAERFVPDPFAAEPGGRLYATGDLVRLRADGDLEFLGRIDHQVKIRGLRIETGEIEAVLAAHPGVRKAVVLAREDTPGDRRLVAYFVPETGTEIAADLRAFLGARLPNYMVPSAFVALDAFPVTTSGKVDRKALPAPDLAALRKTAAPGAPAATPRNEVEKRIAACWREVLGLSEVGIQENFFDLGGHSLLLARLQDRLQGDFGRPIPIVDLFQYPTVRALAERLGNAESAAPAISVEIRGEARTDSTARRRDVRRQLRQAPV